MKFFLAPTLSDHHARSGVRLLRHRRRSPTRRRMEGRRRHTTTRPPQATARLHLMDIPRLATASPTTSSNRPTSRRPTRVTQGIRRRPGILDREALPAKYLAKVTPLRSRASPPPLQISVGPLPRAQTRTPLLMVNPPPILRMAVPRQLPTHRRTTTLSTLQATAQPPPPPLTLIRSTPRRRSTTLLPVGSTMGNSMRTCNMAASTDVRRMLCRRRSRSNRLRLDMKPTRRHMHLRQVMGSRAACAAREAACCSTQGGR
mmetsp:Transcript_56666/g.93683  ORF Transcript_56666/g.93683 Transcript_56666/m.93683 type:complete len:259 (-) Transcript_56666:435-1211(-)